MKKNLEFYEIDASRITGKALNVLHPKTIEEVKSLVINSRRVVPRGAGTGLAGGCVPQEGQDVVIDLSKLDKIENFDMERMTIEVEAGVVLDELQEYIEKYNLEFPVNPSSHSVCTIGGMIATNAVGSRAMKYGRTSNWIKWIEVIDSRGNLQRKGVTELIDYSGMEGITGIIVKACLKLTPKVKRTADLLKFDKLDQIFYNVRELKRNSDISMIEFLDKKVSRDLGLGDVYSLIVEYENNSGKMSGKEYFDLLAMRDKVYPILSNQGYIRIEDPKILLERFVELISWLEEKEVPVFGHISVGILHPCFKKEQEKYIPEMMNFVKRRGGQVSGEHGIGVLKKDFIDTGDKRVLINMKKRIDPSNKFNVGKII